MKDPAHQRRLPAPVPLVPGTVFIPDLLLLKLSPGEGAGRRLGLVQALEVAGRLREALLAHGNDLPPRAQALLSGHGSDGGPLRDDHLAILPLASVGHPRADGSLAGLALALPQSSSGADARHVLRAALRVKHLTLGRLGVWKVARSPGNEPPRAWTAYPAGATHWSTVTPLAFDVHPKAPGELVEMVAKACARISLPAPREIIATQTSAHLGVPPAHNFPRMRRKDGGQRRHTHVILAFARPVRGPMLLGAGRFRGYGLFRPLPGPEARPS